MLLGVDVACDVAAPGLVRDALARLSGIGWILGDAMLVASELVTNAVRHSGGSEKETIEVRVRRGPKALTISVRDPGRSGKRAKVAELAENAIGGLGLRVVDAIAVRWGKRGTAATACGPSSRSPTRRLARAAVSTARPSTSPPRRCGDEQRSLVGAVNAKLGDSRRLAFADHERSG